MNRRKLLGFLASLPFVGAMVRPGDGVALYSTMHPVGLDENVLRDLGEDSLVQTEIELPVYAYKGDIVTCENNHIICAFQNTILVGQTQDLPNQLGWWQQEPPKLGAFPIPGCSKCGAPFADGTRFHFVHGWRGTEGADAYYHRLTLLYTYRTG